MRRGFGAPILKRLLAAGTEAAEPALQGRAALGPGSQAAKGKPSILSRAFSQSTAARSASESVSQAHPYAVYGGVGAIGLGSLYYFWSSQPADAAILPAITTQEPPEPPADRHEIGEFDVLDHTGMHFTQDSLLGNFAVIFFGSIDHPGRKTRLLQMAEAVMESDRKSNMHYLTPVFASLTPEEDDVIKMNAMVQDYATSLNRKDILHVRLKGLSGDDNHKLHTAAQKYTKMVKAKDAVSDPSTATKNDEGDLYFINPEGEFIASYGPDAAPKEIATEWAEIMKAYKLNHPTWHGPKAVKMRHA